MDNIYIKDEHSIDDLPASIKKHYTLQFTHAVGYAVLKGSLVIVNHVTKDELFKMRNEIDKLLFGLK